MIPRVNLIPASRLEAQKRQRLMWRWFYGATIYFLLSVCICVGAQLIKPNEAGATVERIEELKEMIRIDEEQIAKLNAELIQSAKMIRTEQSIRDKPDWSLLLILLGEVAGDEIMLRKCELIPVETAIRPAVAAPADKGKKEAAPQPKPALTYKLELRAFAQSQTAASQFALRLEETGLFDTVRLIKTTAGVFAEDQIYVVELDCRIGMGDKR